MRTGVPDLLLPPSTISKGPTAKATRYEGKGLVWAKRTTLVSPSVASKVIGVFEAAWSARGTRRVKVHGVLNDGSSKHGKLQRASVSSNWVKTYQSSPLFCLKTPRVSFCCSFP